MPARKPVADAAPLPTREQWTAWVNAQIAVNPQFIAPNQLCAEDLHAWQDAAATLARAKSAEALLRDRVFKHFFTAPEEGTNNVKLPDGTKIVAKYPINRSVDEAKLAYLKAWRVDDARAFLTQVLKMDTTGVPDETPVIEFMKLSIDKLIKWKPDVAISEYRTLTAEQAQVFETILDIKPGMPQLAIEAPKVET